MVSWQRVVGLGVSVALVFGFAPERSRADVVWPTQPVAPVADPADLGSVVEATGTGLVRPDWVSAGVTARARNARVEVLSERTGWSRTWALPDGSAVVEDFVDEVRYRDASAAADGWRDIDTSWVRNSDGSVSPKAVPGGLRVQDAAGITRTDVSGAQVVVEPVPGVGLGLPDVDGSTATYREVVPGVDVVVQGLRSGFEWRYVVKTPAAAKRLLAGTGTTRTLPVRVRATKGTVTGDATGVAVSNGQGKTSARVGTVLAWDAKATQTGGPGACGGGFPVGEGACEFQGRV